VNALFDQSLTSGQYFEIDVLELKESVFVGVTTKEAFAEGYKCKGLFFGRNLSNGGALVRQAFGEAIATGQKIGVLTEFDASNATVTFYQDGRCLGPAFVATRRTDGAIFPVVHTSSIGDKFGIRFLDAPAERKRQGKGAAPAHPAEGVWALQKLFTGPELGEVPLAEKMEGQEVTLKVEGDGPGSFRFSARVLNTLNMTATSEPDQSLEPFEKLVPSMVVGTKMMGPEGMMEVEGIVGDGLGKLHKWLARPGSLLLTGATVEMCFAPKADGHEGLPATEVELP